MCAKNILSVMTFDTLIVVKTFYLLSEMIDLNELSDRAFSPGGGGVLPYMGYTGMCRCEGYGFQVVYSRIGYINHSVWA